MLHIGDLEKTSILTSKSIKTQFSTKKSDEIEEEIVRHPTPTVEFDNEHESNEQSHGDLDPDSRSEFPSTSQVQAENLDNVTPGTSHSASSEFRSPSLSQAKVHGGNTATSHREATVVQNPSTSQSDNSQQLVLAKIDALKRQMTKEFAKFAKSGDNNYNDIKEMIPTHSVLEFDMLDRNLREDDQLNQKMKRYLQRYKSVATTNDIYGSVLKRIVDDKVLLDFNFHGVKNKLKFEDYAVVDMIFGKLLSILFSLFMGMICTEYVG